MSKPSPVYEFERYVEQALRHVHLSREEKEEMRTEWLQHLTDSYHAGIKRGLGHDEAVSQATEQFGDPHLLAKEVNSVHPSAWQLRIVKELAVWILILAADLIGPWLLIRARFNFHQFVLFPLMTLFLCFVMHLAVIQGVRGMAWRMKRPAMFWGALAAVCYMVYQSFHVSVFGGIGKYIWHALRYGFIGHAGLAYPLTQHVIWLLMMLVVLARQRSRSPWSSVFQSAFEYWGFLLVAALFIRIFPFFNSDELSVIYGNTVLLYSALQQLFIPEKIYSWFAKVRG